MIDCRAVMAMLWDYIDGELTAGDLDSIREHLALCKRCYPQYAFEIEFLEAVASLKATMPSPPPALQHRVREFVASTH